MIWNLTKRKTLDHSSFVSFRQVWGILFTTWGSFLLLLQIVRYLLPSREHTDTGFVWKIALNKALLFSQAADRSEPLLPIEGASFSLLLDPVACNWKVGKNLKDWEVSESSEQPHLRVYLLPTEPTGPSSNISFTSVPHAHAMVVPPCYVSPFAHMRGSSPWPNEQGHSK